MRLLIGSVGRLKAGPERELFERYVGRAKALGRSLGLSGPDLLECDESKARSPAERKREEAAALAAKGVRGGKTVVFDERGSSFTSQDFAERLTRSRDDGVPTLTVLIGGPDGVSPDLRAEADEVLAFGAATLPHQLVRILVAEQMYRAMTIISHHPYHRA